MTVSKSEYYSNLVEKGVDIFDGYRALSRYLGLGHTTLKNRLNNPNVIKKEHIYALEHVLNNAQADIPESPGKFCPDCGTKSVDKLASSFAFRDRFWCESCKQGFTVYDD